MATIEVDGILSGEHPASHLASVIGAIRVFFYRVFFLCLWSMYLFGICSFRISITIHGNTWVCDAWLAFVLSLQCFYVRVCGYCYKVLLFYYLFIVCCLLLYCFIICCFIVYFSIHFLLRILIMYFCLLFKYLYLDL